MSFPAICDGCAASDHSRHQDWTGPPGIIGGSSCPCRGECTTSVGGLERVLWPHCKVCGYSHHAAVYCAGTTEGQSNG